MTGEQEKETRKAIDILEYVGYNGIWNISKMDYTKFRGCHTPMVTLRADIPCQIDQHEALVILLAQCHSGWTNE